MSIKSTFSIAFAFMVLGAAASAALASEIPANGFLNADSGSAHNALVFNYDARGGLHVATNARSAQASEEDRGAAVRSYASSGVASAQSGSDPALNGGGSAGYNAGETQSVSDR